jgi:hypothetical protein
VAGGAGEACLICCRRFAARACCSRYFSCASLISGFSSPRIRRTTLAQSYYQPLYFMYLHLEHAVLEVYTVASFGRGVV